MYTNVSSDFLEVLARPSRHFAARFKDNGTVIDLNIKNMKVTTGTCGSGKLAVGCAYAAYIDVTAVYTDLILEGKELFLELGLLLDDDSYEWIPFGYWTVQKPKKSMDTMTFQAVDRMAGKLFADYETELTYPATIQAVLAEFATNTGLTVHCNLQTTQQITVPIQGVTQRGALAVIAATLLGNAWIDRNGDVQITSIGGGTSVEVNYDYVKGQPEMDEESTVVEGVKVYTVAGQTDTWIERGSGNTVEVSDVYMTDTTLDAVKANLIGLTYGGGEVSFMGNPLLDPSDIVYFRGGSDMVEYFLVTDQDAEITDSDDVSLSGFDFTSYDVPCLEIVQSFDGGLLTTVTAPGQFETTEQTYTVGAVTEELRRQAKEITVTQAEVQAAQHSADNAMITANGKNKIYYQDDAPTSGMGEGDLWFDTDGGNAIYEYKKTASNPDTYAWTLRQLGQGSIAAGSITAAEINVQNLSSLNALLGPWSIGSSGIYNGKTSLDDNTNGVFIGIDGIQYETTNSVITIDKTYGVRIKSKSTAGESHGFRITSYNGSYTQLLNDSISGWSRYNDTNKNGFNLYSALDSSGNAYGVLELGGYGIPKGIVISSNDPSITITSNSDVGILRCYNASTATTYNIIRNHNNGDISISASSGTLYLGYENTASVQSNCLIYAATAVLATAASGEAYIQARNSGTGNRIYMWSNSNGVVGLASYGANNIQYQILERANNSGVITAYGDWVFSRVVPWKTDIKGTPMISDSADGHRVSLLTSGASGQVGIQAQFGNTGTTYSIGYFNVAASDIRLKKNIEDSTVKALPLINSIHMRAFDWKQDERHQDIGFVADELEKLDSSLAVGGGYTEDGCMSIKSVDMFYLVGYLVKAVQELSAEVKKLKGVA